jgi:hypothetical protein
MKNGAVKQLDSKYGGYAGGSTLTRGPKMPLSARFAYSRHETPWNQAILWRAHCEKEAHVAGFPTVGSADAVKKAGPEVDGLPPIFAGKSLVTVRDGGFMPVVPGSPSDARAKEPSLVSAISNLSKSIQQDVLEQRLKSAREREERLQFLLNTQQNRRERMEKMLVEKILIREKEKERAEMLNADGLLRPAALRGPSAMHPKRFASKA